MKSYQMLNTSAQYRGQSSTESKFLNMIINFIENYLANFTNAWFWWIYQVARNLVRKIFFVIFIVISTSFSCIFSILSEIGSFSEEMFQKTKPAYRDALNKSEFQEKLSYTSALNKNNKNDNKQWKYKIIWYNLTYFANVKTNIGKTFLNLIIKHFPKTNKLHKIFNRNTVKISYSCMSNISSIISGRNKNLFNPTVTQYGCNCPIREDCPLQNQCLTPNIIYRVHVHCKANKDYKFNVGVAQIPFKERFQSSATH